MKSLFETYDRHLKKAAAVPPVERMGVTKRVMLPWILAALAALLLVQALDLPSGLGIWIIAPVGCVAVVGAMFAGSRVGKYGREFDRTPTDPVLREMQGADVLIRALQRVTLNGLSDLNPSTRLQADLRLTPADMSQLRGILSAENLLDAQGLEDMRSGDMTVGSLLRNMSSSWLQARQQPVGAALD
jgi:hypothetical protein